MLSILKSDQPLKIVDENVSLKFREMLMEILINYDVDQYFWKKKYITKILIKIEVKYNLSYKK